MITQIYEIQTPQEAAEVCRLGVDHVGTVLLAPGAEDSPEIAAVVETVRAAGKKSSVIPLFSDPVKVCRSISRLRPDIVHFCDAITDGAGTPLRPEPGLSLQKAVREAFSGILIMRTIPIAPEGAKQGPDPVALCRIYAPLSDFFLTDTFLGNGGAEPGDPVPGFVGITGRTCDWGLAARLCAASPVPVILAGGLGPDNVFEGIIRTAPAGVDSCTRTNALGKDGHSVRFKKDMERVALFLSQARQGGVELSRLRGSKLNTYNS
ncbi:MAG: hypothetical protein AB1921_01095 [Thermodesulfobacteriota bacterium]